MLGAATNLQFSFSETKYSLIHLIAVPREWGVYVICSAVEISYPLTCKF